MKFNDKRHETTHNEDPILGAGPPSNGLCIMKLHKLFYKTFAVCICIHADSKASSTYLILLANSERYVVVDRNYFCNLHRNRNRKRELPLILPSHHTLEPPSSHHHLCIFLMRASFWALWSLLMRQNQATSNYLHSCAV